MHSQHPRNPSISSRAWRASSSARLQHHQQHPPCNQAAQRHWQHQRRLCRQAQVQGQQHPLHQQHQHHCQHHHQHQQQQMMKSPRRWRMCTHQLHMHMRSPPWSHARASSLSGSSPSQCTTPSRCMPVLSPPCHGASHALMGASVCKTA